MMVFQVSWYECQLIPPALKNMWYFPSRKFPVTPVQVPLQKDREILVEYTCDDVESIYVCSEPMNWLRSGN